MTTVPPALSSRPKPSRLPSDSTLPSTPQRQLSSSNFNSPSTSLRETEEPIILSIGSRHLSAGFAGDEQPRCTLSFNAESSRRAGDYRRYAPDYDARPRKRVKLSEWGDDHELWDLDLRKCDIGLVGDKIERATREAFTKYLLVDSKQRRVYLVLPSVLPHKLLDRVLRTLFEGFDILTVTVLSEAVMATAAAGCRSGLVVDIGWKETIVTAVAEYREVRQWRSIRAAKMVGREMASQLQKAGKEQGQRSDPARGDDEGEQVQVDVEQAEDILVRMGWCDPLPPSMPTPTPTAAPPSTSNDGSDDPLPQRAATPASSEISPPIAIPSPFNPSTSLTLPFSSLSQPIESTLLGSSLPRAAHDDHDTPLPLLIYRALTSLAPDTRASCLARIIFTGGISSIAGLKPRLLNEVWILVEKQEGWDPVFGIAAEKRRERVKDVKMEREYISTTEAEGGTGGLKTIKDIDEDKTHGADEQDVTPRAEKSAVQKEGPTPPSQQPQTEDEISAHFATQHSKNFPRGEEAKGELRGLATLGAWAGASLMASLRVKGVVEVEREVFLRGGVEGARKSAHLPPETGKAEGVRANRKSMVDGRGVEKGGWSLGVWA